MALPNSNKNKYFTVTTTQIVSALNMRDAEALAARKRGIDGKVLSTDVETFRITASDARAVFETV